MASPRAQPAAGRFGRGAGQPRRAAARRAGYGPGSGDGGRLRERITGQSRQGRTILLANHLLANAQALADRVTTLGHGKTGQTGTPAPDAVRAVT